MNKFVLNFEFFREKVNGWIGAVDLREKNPRLYKEGFLKFILNRVELLCIECDDEEDAFRLFEVVNDRGMELSPVQVIKPSMMRGMNEDDKREFLEDWGRWTDAGSCGTRCCPGAIITTSAKRTASMYGNRVICAL